MTAAVSPELFAEVQPGITLCYQTFGEPDASPAGPLLLVMGLGGPMTWWTDGLCVLLAEQGFYVIRFDNRDIGRSSRVPGGRTDRAAMVRAFLGRPVEAPYSLADMAADSFGLLDHLGIERAHLAGMSMGGMIVQTMAIAHPERTLSLTSIMSTTGARRVGWQHPSIFPELLRPARNEEEYVEGAVRMWRLIGSTAYPAAPEATRKRARETWARGIDGGVARQMMAILTQPDRTKALAALTVPTTVVHSLGDKMVNVSGGRATAMAVHGARLRLIAGMGHDLPRELWQTLVSEIRSNATRAKTGAV